MKTSKTSIYFSNYWLLAACAQHPDSYQGPAAPHPQDLPPPTNLLTEQ